MQRIAAALALLLAGGCQESAAAPECTVDREECGYLKECLGGACVEVGGYRDCLNADPRCGGVDPLCFTTDDAALGACSWACTSPDECWDAPSGFASNCIELQNGESRCFVVCGDGTACPGAMQCIEGVCLYASDGCGQTASPVEPGQCLCDPGLQWCSADPNDETDPNRLDCCEIPSSGGGGGGDGGTPCCKVCEDSKPCGNSCIASHLQCHQPPGCAC